MTGLREQKKEKTRAAIIKAAISLFGKRGYENTSITALAQAAGVGKGTIYSYFKSKREILLSFFEEELVFLRRKIEQELTKKSSLKDKLVFIFMNQFRYITKNKEFGRTLMREIIFPREITVDKSQAIDNQFIAILVKIFKDAQQKGLLRRDLELTLTCAHFYAIYIMAVSAWYSRRLHSDDEVRSVMETMFEQILAGLQQQPADNT